ncbi:4Fe-4S binding protein [bacterium]|nr:4Fe-4S binding protein [bacterium]MCK5399060.1 4Fe-4S binding protein [bacterium]MCK5600096.1 4Fe-4S binding protein [bacterium]
MLLQLKLPSIRLNKEISVEEKKIELNKVDEFPPMPVSLGSMRVNKTSSWRNFRPIIDGEKCIGCGICWKFCPEPAIFPTNPPEVDYDYCKGCGICIANCPVDAITRQDETK